MIKQLKIVIIVAFVIAYPFISALAIHAGFNQPVLLLMIALSGWRTFRARNRGLRVIFAVMTIALLLGLLLAEAVTIRLIPAVVYLMLAALFGHTLWHPPSLTERMVRLQFPEFKPGISEYLWQLTALWCGFFVANAAACIVLALFADENLWLNYTGFWVYLLMAGLVLGEYFYRPYRFPDLDIPPLWSSLNVMFRNGYKVFRDIRG